MNSGEEHAVIVFKYLESTVSDEGTIPEVLSRIKKRRVVLTRLKLIWNNRDT